MTSTPTPVQVMNTPDPVSVQGLHVAWNTFDVTAWALGIALAAAILAGWALIVAIRDANRNAELFARTMRKPKFELRLLIASWQGTAAGGMKPISLSAMIANTGERAVDKFMFELLVPVYALASPDKVWAYGRTVDGVAYRQMNHEVTATLYPYAAPVSVGTDFIDFADPTKLPEFLWRVYDTTDTYPSPTEWFKTSIVA